MLRVAAVLGILAIVSGYPHYRDDIPNGKNVPHPCKPNYLWKGVGHENVLGGGARNPFGQDFAANNFIWDECLCKYDSDGDGRTNGQELGDPECKWSPGDPAPTTKGLSHPGVCEPYDSEECRWKNSWEIDCSIPEFTCDSVHTDDVKNHTVHLDETAVPAKETIYTCQGVDLPSDGDYHIIAVEPKIVNIEVAHHIILYGCKDENVNTVKAEFSSPTECGMSALICDDMLALWTVGYYGDCHSDEYGIRIGSNGYKYAILEIHWNNPELKSDYKDSSGLTLYYTPKRRTYDATTIFIGPHYLELPPGQREVIQEGHCSPECTEYIFDEPVYIAQIVPHMHYLGRGMVVEHKRNGILIETLVDVDDYNYDAPESLIFDPPHQVLPGDELTVQCTFETTNQKDFIFFGEGTSDEMCLAVVRYYPKQVNSSGCFTTNGVGYCGKLVGEDTLGQCLAGLNEFYYGNGSSSLSVIWPYLAEVCDTAGLECRPGCKERILVVRQHSCLNEDLDHFVLNALADAEGVPKDFNLMMSSCDEREDAHDDDDHDHSAGGGRSHLCDDIVSGANYVASQALAIMLMSIGAFFTVFI